MKTLLSLFIGLRFSYGCYRDSIVSLISVISTSGIAIGVAVLLTCLSAINGFNYELNNRILSIVPHGEIESINQPWQNWLQTLQDISQIHGVTAAAPYVKLTGLINNGANIYAIQIKGINPKQEEKLNTLLKFMPNETWIHFNSGKQRIFIGKGISDKLKVKQGDWVSIMISRINTNYKIHQFKILRLCIAGILQLGSQLDHNFAIIPLEDAQTYLNIGSSITGIAIKVNNIFDVNHIVNNISKILKNHIHIRSWIDTYGYIYHDIQMIRSIIYLTMLLVIGIACFSITSMLVTTIKNKSIDIAILCTLGANKKFIYAIFVWYSVLVCSAGSLCGIIIGVIVSSYLTSILYYIERFINESLLSSKIYFIDFLPSKIYWLDILSILIITFLLSLLASWYPAYRASSIEPIVVLNNKSK